MDVSSGCFIVPAALSLLRHGPGAPIWRAIVTLENCILVNSIAAAIIILCTGYVAKKMCFWYESFANLLDAEKKVVPLPRSRVAPFFAMLALAVVPQFAGLLTPLSPILVSFVPIFLSAAVVASLNSRLEVPVGQDIDVDEDDRHGVGLRLAVAGALAAVGAWESTYGIALALPLLAITWFSFIRRGHSASVVSVCWVVGFMVAFVAEPEILPDCPWQALMPKWVPLFGIVLFLFICVMALAVIRRLGENRWTLGGWGLVLLVFAIITASTGRFRTQSASERFVRAALADLGERKLILGDGRFDVMIDEYKPSDVRRIGSSSAEEKEFLIKLADEDPVITNRVLVLKYCRDQEDFMDALAETGLVYKKLYDEETVSRMVQKRVEKMSDEEKAQIAELREKAFRKKADPLFESLHAMNEGYDDIPKSLLEEETVKAQENIRRGWKNGFGGTRMSNTLLNIDILRGNRKTLEADAVDALVINREDPVANAVLGAIRLEDGKLEDAERYLRKGVKGGGVLAMNRLAMLLVNKGNFAEAEDWARKAVEKVPKDWQSRQPLAAALIENGKFDEAAKELKTIENLAVESDQMKAAEPFLSGARKRLVEKRQK